MTPLKLKVTWFLRITLCVSSSFIITEKTQAHTTYITQGECDGLPRVNLQTIPGTCVGLLTSGLQFPRGIAIKNNTIYVAEMGGWQKNRGRLIALENNGHGARRILLRGLDRPSGLTFSSDGQLYIGLPDRVIRVNLHNDNTASTQDVLTDIPSEGRHPLKALAADSNGGLYVSEGSASNNCETEMGALPDTSRSCPETRGSVPRGSILWFKPGNTPQSVSAQHVVATGIRNAAALTVLPDGKLLAIGNGRDSINVVDLKLSDKTLPHEPLYIIQKGTDYGWPYCFDNKRPAPEYPQHDCSAIPSPDMLLPAHAAPLGVLVYNSQAIPSLAGNIIMTYHGYRDTGHRVMSLKLAADGKPEASPQPVIWGWPDSAHSGRMPSGSPTGLATMPDGTLLISEDHNGTILRLSHTTR